MILSPPYDLMQLSRFAQENLNISDAIVYYIYGDGPEYKLIDPEISVPKYLGGTISEAASTLKRMATYDAIRANSCSQ
jgi:hypothetical protein